MPDRKKRQRKSLTERLAEIDTQIERAESLANRLRARRNQLRTEAKQRAVELLAEVGE